MSFSSDVRDELSFRLGSKNHCCAAELSALLSMCGNVMVSASDRVMIRFVTENRYAALKFDRLIRRMYHIRCEVRVRISRSGRSLMAVVVARHEDAVRILQDTGMLKKTAQAVGGQRTDVKEAEVQKAAAPEAEEQKGAALEAKVQETAVPESEEQKAAAPEAEAQKGAALEAEVLEAAAPEEEVPGSEAIFSAEEGLEDFTRSLLTRKCCQRAYLRGAFLAAGSISDPKKYYHLEITCSSKLRAELLQELTASFGLDGRIVERKGQYVVYIKEGGQIVDMLGVMEAPKSLMELENIRILREITGNINRQVNCETANLNKTVGAAVKQIEDIRYIQEQDGLEKLPEHLKEMAMVRLENPEMSLKDLGQQLDPPLSRAGVNHRLKNLSRIAEEIRERKGEDR